MEFGRREVLAGSVLGFAGSQGWTVYAPAERAGMYGLIGRMTAAAGQRDALLAVLLEATEAMPGCLSYIIAKDPEDADALWITEVWHDRESHRASLELPAVQSAIARARPLIAGFDSRHETEPVGGVGLPRG